MSETRTTELASQYSTQVADDLERNIKEQERLSSEIKALEAQLAALRHDKTMLVSIQQALAASPADPEGTVPAPSGKQQLAGERAATARKRTGRKAAARTPAASSSVPKLVDLVRDHLASQNEPRSANEITTALGQQYLERTIKTTVVRTTLEGLVAKNQAQRTKQGASVFYTAPETIESASPDQPAVEPST